MTDRDRLIELIVQANEVCSNKDCAECEYLNNGRILCDTYNIADYLLANGVIVPPCKVGDKLYDIGEFVLGVVAPDIYELRADEMTIEKGIDGKLNFVYDGMYINNEDMGETVFLTKEEAEEKLKELNGNE